MYDVELTFYDVDAMSNQLFFDIVPEKVKCQHEVEPILKSTKLCTVVYGKLIDFLKNIFKKLFINHSDSLAFDSYNF